MKRINKQISLIDVESDATITVAIISVFAHAESWPLQTCHRGTNVVYCQVCRVFEIRDTRRQEWNSQPGHIRRYGQPLRDRVKKFSGSIVRGRNWLVRQRQLQILRVPRNRIRDEGFYKCCDEYRRIGFVTHATTFLRNISSYIYCIIGLSLNMVIYEPN